MATVVKIGKWAIDLEAICSAHFEGSKLFIHQQGGRFLSLEGEDADRLWQAYVVGALDLRTGEVVSRA